MERELQNKNNVCFYTSASNVGTHIANEVSRAFLLSELGDYSDIMSSSFPEFLELIDNHSKESFIE